MGKSWKIDPQTRDYVMTKGSPTQDDTLKTPAYIRLMAPRNNWLYAPNDKWGSDYYLMHKRVGDYAAVEEVATRALQPVIDDGRASDVEAVITDSQRGAAELKVNITDSSGIPEVFNFTPVGGF